METKHENLHFFLTAAYFANPELKVNDQLVAYATRFLAVRLKKKCVVAPPRFESQSIVRLL